MVNIYERTLEVQRRVTERTIAISGQYIQLSRPAKPVSDGAGGFVPTSVAPITLPGVKRLLAGLTQLGRGVNQQPERYMLTAAGRRMREVLVMVGPADDDVEDGDYWVNDQGQTCIVALVEHDRRYQTKCHVVVVS